jgi:hypothetical protein
MSLIVGVSNMRGGGEGSFTHLFDKLHTLFNVGKGRGRKVDDGNSQLSHTSLGIITGLGVWGFEFWRLEFRSLEFRSLEFGSLGYLSLGLGAWNFGIFGVKARSKAGNANLTEGKHVHSLQKGGREEGRASTWWARPTLRPC